MGFKEHIAFIKMRKIPFNKGYCSIRTFNDGSASMSGTLCKSTSEDEF